MSRRAGRPWLERRAGPELSSGQSADRENFARPKPPERLHLATAKPEPLQMPEGILSTTSTWEFLHLQARRIAPGQSPASTAIWSFLPQIPGSAFTIRLLFPERACWGAGSPGNPGEMSELPVWLFGSSRIWHVPARMALDTARHLNISQHQKLMSELALQATKRTKLSFLEAP